MHAAQFTVDPPRGTGFAIIHSATAVSPDGRFLVFGAVVSGKKNARWLRPIDSLNARELPGTEGGNFPFWSPDSQSLAFFADGKLKRISLVGGAPITLCEAQLPILAGGTWNQEGVILFAREGGLYRVPASGGVAAQVTNPDTTRGERGHGSPQFLSDGRRFLFTVFNNDANLRGVYVASLDRPQEMNRILSTRQKAVYSPPRGNWPGSLLWVRIKLCLRKLSTAQRCGWKGNLRPWRRTSLWVDLSEFALHSGSRMLGCWFTTPQQMRNPESSG